MKAMLILKMMYDAEKELRDRYNKADEADNSEELATIRNDYKDWEVRCKEMGEDFCRVFRMYETAQDVGNEFINVSEVYEYQDVPSMLKLFKEYGIEQFTFSSGWSSAIKAVWEFTQNGCVLEGMVEVNTIHTKFLSDEHEKVPAFLLRV